MNIEIEWQYTGGGEENLDFSRVLYAYLHPETSEILYIGKADRCTVKERLFGAHKEAIFDEMIADLGISELHAIIGLLYVPEERRYSSELLVDIESLLIINVQPQFNTQSRQSRISRPGLNVRCIGEWPHEQEHFIDD
jgi:hypothetical protein